MYLLNNKLALSTKNIFVHCLGRFVGYFICLAKVKIVLVLIEFGSITLINVTACTLANLYLEEQLWHVIEIIVIAFSNLLICLSKFVT